MQNEINKNEEMWSLVAIWVVKWMVFVLKRASVWKQQAALLEMEL